MRIFRFKNQDECLVTKCPHKLHVNDLNPERSDTNLVTVGSWICSGCRFFDRTNSNPGNGLLVHCLNPGSDSDSESVDINIVSFI